MIKCGNCKNFEVIMKLEICDIGICKELFSEFHEMVLSEDRDGEICHCHMPKEEAFNNGEIP